MNLKGRVANRVRTIRKLRGLTQEQLANHIDRTVFAISQLERGLSLPSFETLERLSVALRVPVRDFFDSDDESSGMSPRRMQMTTILDHTVRALSDDDLETTLRIIDAIRFRPEV